MGRTAYCYKSLQRQTQGGKTKRQMFSYSRDVNLILFTFNKWPKMKLTPLHFNDGYELRVIYNCSSCENFHVVLVPTKYNEILEHVLLQEELKGLFTEALCAAHAPIWTDEFMDLINGKVKPEERYY